jgi:predicted Holliday junction resolvase-like endonuclease
MASATDQRPEPLDNEIAMPAWMVWLQLGLSTTLAVLFVVMLVKTRQQSVAIRQLQDKVAGIENSRALDRTTALEDQLRTVSERIQTIERQAALMAGLARQNARLRQELSSKDSASGKPGVLSPLDEGIAPLPPLKP